MNLFDRFILTIYSLALIVLSIVAIGISSRLVPYDRVLGVVDGMYGTPGMNIPYLVVSIILLVISVRFFISAFTVRRRGVQAIRQRGEYGDVTISFDTIRSIAERTARRVRGVRDLKTSVQSLDNRTFVTLQVGVDGETPLPELTLQLQHDVKEQVETITGVEVTEVTVHVAEVVAGEHVPVRTRRVE